MPKAPVSPHPWIEIVNPHVFAMHFPDVSTDEELGAFLDAFYDLAQRVHHRYTWVVDMGGVINAPASQRKMYALNEERVAPYSAEFCAGVATIAKSSLARGLITAVYWLKTPVYPYTIVSSQESAMAWVRMKLAEEGIEVR